jgi:NADH-quinone oxidoreductase subunit G
MIFINFLKKNSKNQKILNKFKNNISIIFGNEVIETNEHVNLIKTIKQFNNLFIKFEYNVLELYSGKINILEFGLFNLNKISKIKNKIFYLLNSEVLNYYKKGDFVIFQGDHNIKIREYFDVILPNSNWTETSNLYLNCFGYIQKSQFTTFPPINSREN